MMACPKCGCKTTYEYTGENWDNSESYPTSGQEVCAHCGNIFFDFEDEIDEEEEMFQEMDMLDQLSH